MIIKVRIFSESQLRGLHKNVLYFWFKPQGRPEMNKTKVGTFFETLSMNEKVRGGEVKSYSISN